MKNICRITNWESISLGAAIVLALGFVHPCESWAQKKNEPPQPPSPVSTLELEKMQTRIIRADKPRIVDGLNSALIIEGWSVEQADSELGTVHATSLRTLQGVGPQNDWILQYDEKTQLRLLTKPERRFFRLRAWTRWFELKATVEPWEADSWRVRIAIVKLGLPPDSTRSKASVAPFSATLNMVRSDDQVIGVVLDEALIYNQLFEKLERELATRN